MTFRGREQLFHDLSQLARSGVSLQRSLDVLGRDSNRHTRACVERLRQNFELSRSVHGAFREAGFPESDAAVIEAGEASGRLDTVFSELEEFYHELADSKQTILRKSLYPVIVLHLGAVLLAIPPAILEGGWQTFFVQAGSVLGGFYVLLLAAILLWQALRRRAAKSPTAAAFLTSVPGLGGFFRDLTSWKFSTVLAMSVRAGGSLLKAFENAGTGCGNARLRTASASIVALVRSGNTLSESSRAQGFPPTLTRAIEIGESAGRLDQELHRAAAIFKEGTLTRLNSFADWSPKLIYILISLVLAWKIIQTFLTVSRHIGAALGIES